MIDNGFPLTTEPNILREMITPPSIVSKVFSVVTGNSSNVNSTLPGASSTFVPWRPAKVEHSSNEVYVELVEEDGFVVTADEEMWRGESIEKIMEHSSITYRPFWMNDVESNVLEPLCKETSELIYLDPDISALVNSKYEYEMESELLPGIDKVMDYSADDSYGRTGIGFGLV